MADAFANIRFSFLRRVLPTETTVSQSLLTLRVRTEAKKPE